MLNHTKWNIDFKTVLLIRLIDARTNALVRSFIPKENSMKFVTQYYLDNICFETNGMPRKLFDYKCSYDIELKWCC